MAYVLSIDDLTVTLGDAERRFTLRAGKWSIAAGEVIGLTGPSGTGKTLLLELLGMLRAPDAGRYRAEPLAGETGAPQAFDSFWKAPNAIALCAQARARFFGFVPQAGGLLPFLTVAENVEISQRIAKRPDPDWASALLGELGLSQIAHLRPGALSIGQRQRVAIARALAHRPFCVIADEPTAALDPENAQAAMGLLIEAAQAGGTATLLSSHDFPTLSHFAMRRMALQITSAPHDPNVVSTLVPLEAQKTASAPQEVSG
ncbi:ABC transporter ATP-binding protein [Roseobacter weihaiensis]|uniref:ABC transporter ATP-binding protein n=1 Tax=Roseobacter weihaiensis TaxID=2763262 RepID=UPI001D09F7E8|nr:ATP-binding cassette domain-containing protein [Roseobacter sp. H9]